jgi:hypothetical protein
MALAGTSLAGATLFLWPPAAAFVKTGELLSTDQRDFRLFDNLADASAHDEITPDTQFPGAYGASRAVWKAFVEWGSGPHGTGTGDPTQPNLGDGGANFDPAWAGRASGVGGVNDNIVSALASCGGGTLAFLESPVGDGWRLRVCDDFVWSDGPGPAAPGEIDLQAILTHEFGHALGLAHSTVPGATMASSSLGPLENVRSIEPDDIAGVQCIYGIAAPAKPRIDSVLVGAGMLTLVGVNFAATANEVWFTRAAPSDPASDPLVRVLGVVSTLGGTRIDLAVPAGAGAGDVLVKLPGSTNGATLSNAFPTDLGQFPAASSVFRNGSGMNRACLMSLSPPVLGTSWQLQVDVSVHPGATLTAVIVYSAPDSGTFLPAGEVLVDLASPRLARSLRPPGLLHIFDLPADSRLIGLHSSTQALIVGGGAELCNAEDQVLGL